MNERAERRAPRWRRRAVGALVAAGVLLAASGDRAAATAASTDGTSGSGATAPGTGAGEATRGGVLRAASAVDVTTLDPHAGTSGDDNG